MREGRLIIEIAKPWKHRRRQRHRIGWGRSAQAPVLAPCDALCAVSGGRSRKELICLAAEKLYCANTGLVLEGGGTRGAYTSGVLEVFLREGITFPVAYGISAGACNALSYISGQKERNFRIFYEYITDERYLSITSLYKTGSLFGFDFIFGELFHELLPLDYEAFFQSSMELKAGATDLRTGRAVFFGKDEMDADLTPVRASSSLPFVSPIVSYKGYELLDGGCAMPIPLEPVSYTHLTMFLAVLVMVGNLLSDILYGMVDPRIRLK